MAIMFDDFKPYIEFVDVSIDNPRDSKKIIFRCKGDPATMIKWCRRNFGNRGDGWDFTGSGNKLDIMIWSSKLITMYELWHG